MLRGVPETPEPPVNEALLRRIEARLEELTARQSELATRLARLESGDPARQLTRGSPRERVIHFLDQFRAGEALGEASLGAWIAVCQDPLLRGGLRTVQTREASHVRLLAERIKELGGAPHCEIPDATWERVMRTSASTETSDAAKVRAFVERFPDPDRALAPIRAIAEHLDDDPETRSLLMAIAQDERATLELFYRAAERLAG